MVARRLKTISRILIANRGEIAVRIARTCRRLGIETVAVYSDADRSALHVLECDRAVHIGGSAPSASYLNIAKIIAVAQEAGADALHPGYGLLSENPALAEACDAAGIIFIGPTAEAIRAMGDKAHARALAIEHGVPVIPGYQGEEQDVAYLLKQAEKIGFPVMIKASAGGGGRGMRLVEKPDAFERAADAARRESERAFGSGGLVLERAITEGRHIEIQVLADTHGNIVHLGERDCSVQRRHQKVIEESPSTAVNAKLRAKMGENATRLARAVGYVNAGTIEFMLDADGSFYFLEMNTRLQVEHGVTELCTDTDIVALQIAIATGEKLAFTQAGVKSHGHAIECRVYAEDPLKNYTPSPGPVKVLRVPSGPYVRNDVGTYEGDEISTYYDPMISKLLTFGASRLEAIERMEEALSAYRVEGVKTNLSLLRAVIAHPAFRAGDVTTQFLDKHLAADAIAGTATEEVLLAAFGYTVLDGLNTDPWRAAGPIRSGGTARLDIDYGGRVQIVEGQREVGTRDCWTVSAVHRERRVRYALAASDHVLMEFDEGTVSARVTPRPGGVEVTVGDRTYALSWAAGEHQRGVADTPRAAALTAPMPGLVLKVMARPGQKVKAHQTLVVLEAMKMEHAIEAPHDGVVKAVHCKEGGRVGEGAVLVELEGEVMRLPARVTITEVGPGHGLQNESRAIPLADKVRLIDALSGTGLRRIEAASFVSAKAIPQMAKATEVMAGIERRPGVTYIGLVPNEVGARNAIAANVDEISVVVSASEGHNQANVNRSVAESLSAIRNVGALAREAGIPWTAYIATSFGCPYEGNVDPARVIAIAEELRVMGPAVIALGDTIGVANPKQVTEIVSRFASALGVAPRLHFHDTRGMALANVVAAMDEGATEFDSSIGGLGGCPYAPGASGNVATEDMIAMLHAMGVETGVNLQALLEVAWLAEEIIGRPLEGRMKRSVPRPLAG